MERPRRRVDTAPLLGDTAPDYPDPALRDPMGHLCHVGCSERRTWPSLTRSGPVMDRPLRAHAAAPDTSVTDQSLGLGRLVAYIIDLLETYATNGSQRLEDHSHLAARLFSGKSKSAEERAVGSRVVLLADLGRWIQASRVGTLVMAILCFMMGGRYTYLLPRLADVCVLLMCGILR